MKLCLKKTGIWLKIACTRMSESFSEESKTILITAIRKEVVEAYVELHTVQKKLRRIDELLYGLEYGLEAEHE